MIVIPMAGASSRFAAAGYTFPKYRLDLNGRPVFDYAVAGFAYYFANTPFLFICLDEPGTADFIAQRCAALGLSDVRIVGLPSRTHGQAHTVALGLDAAGVDAAEPIIIFNIDSFRRGFVLYPDDASADGMLETFRGSGDGWSFVLADPQRPGRVALTAEKRRISELCSNGLYYFRTRALFDTAYRAECTTPSQLGVSEHFIAPMYNQLIASGLVVVYREVTERDVVFCGVPFEYENLRGNPAPLQGFFRA
jgi:hypothetical protein